MNKLPSIKKSLSIVGLEKISLLFFQFISSIILARLLVPSDFGTVAMLSIFISLSGTIVDCGFGGSLIYHQDVTEKDFSTIFWINLISSIILYLIMVLCSGWIASFYETEILSKLIRILGLTIVFNALGQVQYSMIYKSLDFVKIFYINVSTYVVSAIIAIILAYFGFGVWALITQQVLSSVLRTVVLISCNRFFPQMYFSIPLLKKHWNYGSGLFFSNILRTVYDNLYVQLIGKYTSIVDAGYYNQAKKLKDIPADLLSRIFSTTLFPVFSKITDDKEFIDKFRKVSTMFAFFCCPIFFVISFLSDNIVVLLLGSKWLESGWMLRIICPGALFYIFEAINRNALKAKGKSQLIFRLDLIKRSIALGIMLIGVWKFQVLGICVAFVINSILGWAFNAVALSRYSCYSLKSQLTDVLKYTVLSVLIYLITYFLRANITLDSDLLSILIYSATFAGMYCLFLIVFRDRLLMHLIKNRHNER